MGLPLLTGIDQKFGLYRGPLTQVHFFVWCQGAGLEGFTFGNLPVCCYYDSYVDSCYYDLYVDSGGPNGEVEDHVIVIGVIVAIIIFIPVLLLLACIIYKLRQKFNSLSLQNNSRDRRISFENPLSEQTWQLKGLIGQGRYGYVYKADYHGNVVAIKIFATHSRTAWENERNLYSMESTAHENIMEYIASDVRGSGIALQRVLMTRFYPIGSLNNYLRLRILSWSQSCVMIRSIARGLAHLHSESYMNYSGVIAEKYSIAHR